MGAKPRKYFQAGGTLRSTTPSYVERPADQQLFETIQRGELAYVLTPRQMGKSSLIVRTEKKCRSLDFDTSVIDLTSLGTVSTEQIDSWYISLLNQVKEDVNLPLEPSTWWRDQESTPSQRFLNFLREVAEKYIEKQLIIFIDEIDSMLRLDFRADFFAAIRAQANAQARDELFGKITFILVGVALPNDLIDDNQRTPFNVGIEIPLLDLSIKDSAPLINGLKNKFKDESQAIFERIYYWTSGQPYLTQRLCQKLLTSEKETFSDSDIDELVNSTFIKATKKDTNITDIEHYVLSYSRKNRLLKVYRNILNGKRIKEDANSTDQARLKLIGFVKVENGILKIRNRIYQSIFDRKWVKNNLDTQMPIYTAFAVVASLLAFIIGLFTVEQVRSRRVESAMDIIRFPESVLHDKERMEIDTAAVAQVFCSKQTMIIGSNYVDQGIEAISKRGEFGGWKHQNGFYSHSHFLDKPECLLKIIKHVSSSLAEYDNHETTWMLTTMRDELGDLNKTLQVQSDQISTMYDGLDSWIKGRIAFKENNFEAAIAFYDEAELKIANNPSLKFDRAIAHTQNKNFDLALRDFEGVLSLSSLNDAPTPTPTVTPTPSQTPLPTNTPFPTLEAIINPTKTTPVSSIEAVTSSPTIHSTTPTPKVVLLTPTLAYTPTPSQPMRSNFVKPYDRLSAVTNYIRRNQDLAGFLFTRSSSDLDGLPNLRDYVVGQIPTPSQTPSSTPSSTPEETGINAVDQEPTSQISTPPPPPSLEPSPTQTSLPARVAEVVNPASIFSGPGIGNYTEITFLNIGETITIIGRSANNSWLFIETNEGVKGWVSERRLSYTGSIIQFKVTSEIIPITPSPIFLTSTLLPYDEKLSFDFWHLPGKSSCSGDEWMQTIFMHGHGDSGIYTYYIDGKKIVGPTSDSYTHELRGRTSGDSVTITGLVVATSGKQIERVMIFPSPCS